MRFFARLFRSRAAAASPAQPPPFASQRALPALPPSRLTLEDWRASGERAAYVAELLANPMFRELLGMLSSLRATHRGSLDATTAAFLLGTRAGSDLILSSLLSAGTQLPAPPADVPADYAAANTLAAWESKADT